jgi:hypothetical protein
MEHDKALTLPLVFSYSGTILGNGFLAEIEMSGRLLACQEIEGFWLYGVRPGALAVADSTLAAANVALRETLSRLFIDLAGGAATFEQFKATLKTYFDETDPETLQEWDEAVSRVRKGSMNVPNGLPKQTAESEPFIHVKLKHINEVTPADNLAAPANAPMALAAAA